MTALEKSRVLKVYGDSANGLYDEFMMDYVHRLHPASRIAYKSLFRILSSHLEKTSGGSALEVGVGTGRNLHRYPENISFVGVDITPEMLNAAKGKGSAFAAGGMSAKIEAAGIENIVIRSPMHCETRRGICGKCYGKDLMTGKTGRRFLLRTL